MTIKSIFSTLLLLSAIILPSAVYGQASTRYELSFSDFNELKVVDGINVDYECNPSKAGKVEFNTTSGLADAVIFEPSNDKLTIKLAIKDGNYTNLPTIKVYSSYLTKVTNEGDSLIRVLSVAPGPKFACRVMGNGRISVRNVQTNDADISIISGHGTIAIYGQANTAKFKITGAGHIQADELKAKEVSGNVTGTGTVNCYATHLLKAKGIGSGKIIYRGTPQIDKSFLSNVKLFSVDAPKQ